MRLLTITGALMLGLSTASASADGRWRLAGPGGGGWIQSVCASPHDADELFVGCDVGGFYRSADGGRSYRIHNTGMEGQWVECIVPHAADPSIITIGCLSGVYRSTDRGATWRWLRNGFPAPERYRWSAPIGALVADPTDPDVLYAGIGCPRRGAWGQGAVYRSRDGGDSWALANAAGQLPEDVLISDLLVDPRDPAHLHLACPEGVFQSFDRAETWRKTSEGLPHPHVRRIARCRDVPDRMYLTLRSPPGRELLQLWAFPRGRRLGPPGP